VRGKVEEEREKVGEEKEEERGKIGEEKEEEREGRLVEERR